MIFGVGTDVCDIRRIRAAWSRRGQRFAERILGPHEIQVFNLRLQKVEARGISFLATRFSAKEAFSKAIGMGMHSPMSWRNCEILNLPGGKPVLRLSGVLAEWFESRRLVGHVSVSDESDVATSFVVVESSTTNQLKVNDGPAYASR